MSYFKHRLKKSKYGAVRTRHLGYSFASQGEANCFSMLKMLESAGKIEILQVQPQVKLTDASIIYKPDFKILDLSLNEEVFIEYKGMETDVWKIKKKLWIFYGPAILRIYKTIGNRVTLVEEIKKAAK